ncbi:MAG: SpoIIE family protein phosphatase [Selenomonadaceae bacterium]|nr:SpoIIE family protein phosphatase [Selenomonadaceae bacterium]
MIPSLLLVSEDPQDFLKKGLREIMEDTAQVITSGSGLEGLLKFQETSPMLVIVDSDLPDICGASITSIIKDTPEGRKTIVYLINVRSLLLNVKADRLISAPINYEVLFEQVHQDFERKLFYHTRSAEVEQAISNQQGMLPSKLKHDNFEVDFLYSPYNTLSGDGMFYWYPPPTDTKNVLYGFLFDCTGHDLSSYGQAGMVWVTLRHQLDFLQKDIYSNLAMVLDSVNKDTFRFYCNSDEPQLTSVIVFCVDFLKKELRFAPAGAPEILIKKENTLKRIQTSSHPIGFSEDTEYEEKSVPLENVKEIIFSTDGLSELFLCNQEGRFVLHEAKHDDVSAIFIKLKDKNPSTMDGI